LSTGRGILAERATVSLPNVLTSDDGLRVSRLLDHPNETIRHNLLSWLVLTFDPERSTRLHEVIDASGISDDASKKTRRGSQSTYASDWNRRSIPSRDRC